VLAVAGVVLLLGAAGALGVWQLGGGSERGDGRPATESPVAGPVAVPSIAATVPADVISTGRLVVGVNVPYPPAEFKDASGHIVGFDVDLMNAVTRTLGLVPDYREAPFDAIILTAAGDAIPSQVLDQLSPEGVLVAPVGSPSSQMLLRIRGNGQGDFIQEELGAVSFVPLLGGIG